MHLVNIWYTTPSKVSYAFTGFLKQRVFSPGKLFKKAFGFDMPEGTQFGQYKPSFNTVLS